MAKRKAVRRKARKAKTRKVKPHPRQAKATSPRAVEAALAGIAHDIRTPLTGILALAELLASSNLGARERQWANAVKSGAEHIAALTTLIVDAAKAEAARLVLRNEPFSPRRLAEAVGGALAARAESKGISAKIEIANNLPAVVSGDMLRLRAALENLADNAVKFTGQGGVNFTCSSKPGGRGRALLVFTFTDSGIGLSKKDIARLFRPFAQASVEVARKYGGAGLGLVFVRRLVELMGGKVTVSGEPGRGSTFRLAIPADVIDARPVAEHDAARASPARALTVLCAEDNPYGRVVMNTILNELGHRVDFVETGEAAVAAAARGGYDAVLMDVMLPTFDGIEATRRIRALDGMPGRVPVIGISGRGESNNEQAARAAGMNFYFVKPVSPERLAQALAEVTR